MKTLCIISMLFLAVVSAQSPAPEPAKKDFAVSKMGSSKEKRAKFLILWDALQHKAPEVAGKRMEFTVLQALEKRGKMRVYRADGPEGEAAVLLLDDGLLEGARTVAFVKEAGVHDGTTVLGAAKRMKRYQEVERVADPEAPGREEFLERIKAGETFRVTILAAGACVKCFGDGELGALQGNKICPDCDGHGDAYQEWTLRW